MLTNKRKRELIKEANRLLDRANYLLEKIFEECMKNGKIDTTKTEV